MALNLMDLQTFPPQTEHKQIIFKRGRQLLKTQGINNMYKN